MRNSKISRGNQKSGFFSGKGFYIALAISLVAIGGAVWIGVNSSLEKLENENEQINPTPAPITDYNEEWTLPRGEEVNIPQSDVPAETIKQEENKPKETTPVQQGFILPLNGEILNAYSGDKVVKSKTLDEWVMHTGIDISAQASTPVKAAAAGKVIEVKNDDMWGACVVIDHGNGVESHYYNLKSAINVKKNQQVKLGDTIGAVGETAEIERAEAPHLHFAIKQNGEWIDPMTLIQK